MRRLTKEDIKVGTQFEHMFGHNIYTIERFIRHYSDSSMCDVSYNHSDNGVTKKIILRDIFLSYKYCYLIQGVIDLDGDDEGCI